jgi:hypothetical protein
LDSDDIFFSNKVDQVVKAHRTHPEAVLIYHRLQIIDSAGVKKHRPWPRDVWAGSLQDRVVRSGGWWPRPTTSAMVFTRTFLERLHPMPECSIAGRATWPDAYAGDLAPFLGDVVGLRDALACYRLHGRNNSQTQFNAKIRADQHVYEREQLQRGLSCFGIDISLNDIDCNFGYIRESYVLHRDASARRMFWLIATCPFLSFSSRIRELAKLAVRRR